MQKKDLRQLNEWLWEISPERDERMRVPARIYSSAEMLEDILEDDSADQLIQGAMMPGIESPALVMPDCHQGYSVPIGFVGATRIEDGVISPGACGFDINCGMRLLASSRKYQDISGYLDRLIQKIGEKVPSGLGKGRVEGKRFTSSEIDNILALGASYVIDSGFGEKEDADRCEEQGKMDNADPGAVSKQAKKRGKDQVGTLGSGNHFLEIQKVEEIFDEQTASVFGLEKDQVTVMIHCGSRGLGHQVCSDYLDSLASAQKSYGVKMPSKDFVGVPFQSEEGREYFNAMAAAANYAWANRQMIAHFVREVWGKVLEGKGDSLKTVYDVAHNIIKQEKYEINGRTRELAVHRKGATRAFPAGSSEIPEDYKQTGQPVLIPGSMGTYSYVLAGEKTGIQSFYSASHGAGRVMSRRQARKKFRGEEEEKKLNDKGILLSSGSKRGIAEEAPGVYKNIDNVIDVVEKAGLSRKVAKLKPVAVIKGE